MASISSQYADPAQFPQECEFLPSLIGSFTRSIRDYVHASYPDAKFEVLYPPDVNDTALNQIINFPLSDWTPENLTCLKTENFSYTAARNLDMARQSIELPRTLGFPAAQCSHLVGISRLHNSVAT